MLSVFDSKARAYARPFFVAHNDVGIRAFKAQANNPETEMYAGPEDFSLWHLGTFNDVNAHMELRQQPESIAFAANLKEGHVQSKGTQVAFGNEAPVQRGSTRGDSSLKL